MKRRLSLVSDSEQLQGKVSAQFERLARIAAPGSPEHRGVLSIAQALAADCVRTSVPPSAQKELSVGLSALSEFIAGGDEAKALNARETCFQAVSAIEDMTVSAVVRARAHLGNVAQTPLDHHADHVVERYARNAAHFAVSALCHALDGVRTAEATLEVPRDAEGARAFQSAGLGAARHAAFRSAAFDQAVWEAGRMGESAESQATQALAIQIFHEYLGGRYRSHADAERARQEKFIHWALSGAR